MKKLSVILLALLVGIMLSISAWAYPVPINYKMKFQNLEGFIGAPPIAAPDGVENNWGIMSITDIYDLDLGPLASPVWQEGDNGEHIRVVYWGLDINSWPVDPGAFTTVAAISTPDATAIPYAGADVWLWDEDLAGYLPVNAGIPRPAGTFNQYPTISGGNAGLQVSLQFMPGINVNPLVLTNGTTFGTGLPPTGHGAGYFDVIPGSGPISGLIDTNGFPTMWGFRDMFAEFDFRIPGAGIFELNSDDPLLGHAVPEPSTILLLGAGLFGLGVFARKRMKK